MKKTVILGIGAAVLVMSSCVESSQKYKDLLARADSLNAVTVQQNREMETMFAGINEVTAGIQSLREAEHLLTLEVEKEKKGATKSQQQLARLKNDVQSMTEAITAYKARIADLEGKNKKQSASFRQMIANLNAELVQRSEKLNELTAQLAASNKALAAKTDEVKNLTANVDALGKETAEQKMTIASQDQTIHTAHYLLGSRKALKDAGIISRQGIFCPPIVSGQTQGADFVQVDIREAKTIALNDKKAKLLSVHPEGSYTLETDDSGNLVLKIADEQAFWRQTKYLVVMVG